MFEQSLLRDQFQELLTKERQAAAAYSDLVAKLDDPQLRRQVELLCREKQRHVLLAERLLEIVE